VAAGDVGRAAGEVLLPVDPNFLIRRLSKRRCLTGQLTFLARPQVLVSRWYPRNHRLRRWGLSFESFDFASELESSAQVAEQKRLFDWLSEKLSIRSLDDWYHVSLDQVQKWMTLKPLSRKTLASLLQSTYPQHQWNMQRLLSFSIVASKASQRHLAATLRELFPRKGTTVGS
jgi:hypothetical protein